MGLGNIGGNSIDIHKTISDGRFMIDGVSVKPPNYPYKFQLNSVGFGGRTLNQSRFWTVLANMKKLFWNYTALTTEELDVILGIINTKLEQGNDIFSVTSYVHGKGFITDNYYPNQPMEYEQIGPDLWKWELHWIQVYGKKTL